MGAGTLSRERQEVPQAVYALPISDGFTDAELDAAMREAVAMVRPRR
jgi:hypothetical protein